LKPLHDAYFIQIMEQVCEKRDIFVTQWNINCLCKIERERERGREREREREE
jgi:hypothetical protein